MSSSVSRESALNILGLSLLDDGRTSSRQHLITCGRAQLTTEGFLHTIRRFCHRYVIPLSYLTPTINERTCLATLSVSSSALTMSFEKAARDASSEATNSIPSNGLDLASLSRGDQPLSRPDTEVSPTHLTFNSPTLSIPESIPGAGDKLAASSTLDTGSLSLDSTDLYAAKASQLFATPDTKSVAAIASDYLGQNLDFTPQRESANFVSPIAMNADSWNQLASRKTTV